MTMHKFFSRWIMLAFAGFLTACANMPIKAPEAPKVSGAELKLINFALHEQNFLLQVHLKNPNLFALPIVGVNFRLFFNDKEVLSGAGQPNTTIPASGEAPVDIEVTTDLVKILKDLPDWKEVIKARKLRYRVEGSVHLKTIQFKIPFEVEVPFEHQGELPLGKYWDLLGYKNLKFSVEGFKLVKFDEYEQTYRLQVRLQNTNFFPLSIASVNFQLDFNDQKFITGTSSPPTTIPASGSVLLDVDFSLNLINIIKGLPDWKNAIKDRQLTYRIDGSISTEDWESQISIGDQGEISLEENWDFFFKKLLPQELDGLQRFLPL